jgi:osmotically-inducible protein OsmY
MKFAVAILAVLLSTPVLAQQEQKQSNTEWVKDGAQNAGLTGRVKTALANDVGLKTLIINVDSDDGVVTLRGSVDSADTKSRAEQVAKKVDGVKSVKNELRVKGS